MGKASDFSQKFGPVVEAIKPGEIQSFLRSIKQDYNTTAEIEDGQLFVDIEDESEMPILKKDIEATGLFTSIETNGTELKAVSVDKEEVSDSQQVMAVFNILMQRIDRKPVAKKAQKFEDLVKSLITVATATPRGEKEVRNLLKSAIKTVNESIEESSLSSKDIKSVLSKFSSSEDIAKMLAAVSEYCQEALDAADENKKSQELGEAMLKAIKIIKSTGKF